MTQEQIEQLKQHFLEWSGGFEPESAYQITVYVDYAAPVSLDANEVRRVLEDWTSEACQEKRTQGPCKS